MTPRPTPKAVIIGGIGGVLVVVGTTAQAGWIFVLAAGVLGLAVSGFLAHWRLVAEVDRALPEGMRPRVGDAVPVGLRLRNPGTRRLPVMRVEDSFPALEDVALACESLPPGGTASREIERTAARRGVFDRGEVVLTTGGAFGLFRRKHTASLSSKLIVHPRWDALKAFPLPDTPAATADEALAVARAGHGDVFAGVREYRPGDPQRWVHWRTTARTGRLVVREHEEPARSPVVLVVAGAPAAHEADEWEQLVADAASVGVYALASGRPVSCAGASRFGDFVANVSQLQLLDWCAGIDASDAAPETLVAGAFRRWGRRCSFVFFTLRHDAVEGAARLARSRGSDLEIVEAGSLTAGEPG
jgi:uncharacterized protein (DUF58 family)